MRPLLELWLLAVIVLGSTPTVAQDTDSTTMVTGIVALEPMEQPPVGARYRGRTRTPVLEPEPPRAIVYLVPEDGRYPEQPRHDSVTVGQRGYQFRPAVVAVQVGGQAMFPNRDDEFHNVFSYSPAKRFDLGRYRKGEQTPPIIFDEPGLVRVYCEIHKHMRALLLVLETPWFTATDHEGRFELTDVPAGDYEIRAFLPSERTLRSQVTVPREGSVRVELIDAPGGGR